MSKQIDYEEMVSELMDGFVLREYLLYDMERRGLENKVTIKLEAVLAMESDPIFRDRTKAAVSNTYKILKKHIGPLL